MLLRTVAVVSQQLQQLFEFFAYLLEMPIQAPKMGVLAVFGPVFES